MKRGRFTKSIDLNEDAYHHHHHHPFHLHQNCCDNYYLTNFFILGISLALAAALGPADVNHVDINGVSSLIQVSRDGHVDVVKLLIAASGNVNHVNLEGVSSLIYASQSGHVDVVKLLIAANADIHHVANNGETALSLAKAKKHDEIVAILEEKITQLALMAATAAALIDSNSKRQGKAKGSSKRKRDA